jgi:DUF971 family protein
MRLPQPKEVRRLGTQSLRIVWDDGHESQYDNPYLRNHCPCAECRERPQHRVPLARGQGDALYAKQIGVVGRYALSIEWSDGHDSGIYSYSTLRALCPCDVCRPPGDEEGREKAS